MRTDQGFTTRIDAQNGVTSIALTGELDMATAPILNEQLTTSEQDGSKAIVLDLRHLSFMDSSGLHELVQAYRRSETNGHRLVVVGASPTTRRLCEITGTEFLLDAKDSVDVLGRFTGDGSRMGNQDDEVSAELHV